MPSFPPNLPMLLLRAAVVTAAASVIVGFAFYTHRKMNPPLAAPTVNASPDAPSGSVPDFTAAQPKPPIKMFPGSKSAVIEFEPEPAVSIRGTPNSQVFAPATLDPNGAPFILSPSIPLPASDTPDASRQEHIVSEGTGALQLSPSAPVRPMMAPGSKSVDLHLLELIPGKLTIGQGAALPPIRPANAPKASEGQQQAAPAPAPNPPPSAPTPPPKMMAPGSKALPMSWLEQPRPLTPPPAAPPVQK